MEKRPVPSTADGKGNGGLRGSVFALLAWRNSHSEQLGRSPSQMFGRRCRTSLPATDKLLASHHAAVSHDALVAVKARQEHYYNHIG